jgi:uncharacterized protein YeaO (DUF488 family)
MPSSRPRIAIARAYDVAPSHRGYRVLVDRLWPRGVTKEDLALDGWFRELAPSTPLRRWFNHRPERWDEFRKRYFRELQEKQNDVGELLSVAAKKPLLLIYGARDEEHNNAVALREFLLSTAGKS